VRAELVGRGKVSCNGIAGESLLPSARLKKLASCVGPRLIRKEELGVKEKGGEGDGLGRRQEHEKTSKQRKKPHKKGTDSRSAWIVGFCRGGSSIGKL